MSRRKFAQSGHPASHPRSKVSTQTDFVKTGSEKNQATMKPRLRQDRGLQYQRCLTKSSVLHPKTLLVPFRK
jgi:hypothetical protein